MLMHWSESDIIEKVKRVRVELPDGTGDEREISRVRKAGRGYLVVFDGISDRNAAEQLRGARILVPRTELPEAEPGEAYLSDLVGRQVFGPEGVLVGSVVDVASYPSVDSLVIERVGGGTVEQPLVDDWIEPLDASSSRIVLRSLDGIVGE